jgi:hypothetical protein
MMFPDRAPSDMYLYTTFIGGTRNRELARASTYLYCYTLFVIIYSAQSFMYPLHSLYQSIITLIWLIFI